MSHKLGLRKRRLAQGGDDHDPNTSWALVELYRWQHGGLPEPGKQKPLDISVALNKAADALSSRDPKTFPLPTNIASVLRLLAKDYKD